MRSASTIARCPTVLRIISPACSCSGPICGSGANTRGWQWIPGWWRRRLETRWMAEALKQFSPKNRIRKECSYGWLIGAKNRTPSGTKRRGGRQRTQPDRLDGGMAVAVLGIGTGDGRECFPVVLGLQVRLRRRTEFRKPGIHALLPHAVLGRVDSARRVHRHLVRMAGADGEAGCPGAVHPRRRSPQDRRAMEHHRGHQPVHLYRGKLLAELGRRV